ncbi:MAG: N-6 DNA methylase [Planctomycetota bacterium]|jgi:hypothetical protein|nr:N-6 DNA methylase [Planctomycetota bacterium]
MPGRGDGADFAALRVEGSLLPAAFLRRLGEKENDSALGLTPEFYGVTESRLRDAISDAWQRARTCWAQFKAKRSELPESDLGIALTRKNWLLPLFKLLSFGELQPGPAEEINEKTYPISHRWNRTFPVHLVGFRQKLDDRPAGRGNWKPHALLQEYLNLSDSALWGMVSNGLQLRLLRDNAAVTRLAYVEFDLEAIFETEAYADFSLFWLVCHQSRVAGERPEACWLEKWFETARLEGQRALMRLSDSVRQAIGHFGTGFLRHPGNAELRRRLREGELDKRDFFRQLLRLAYRLLFLFVAEDRNLLQQPTATDEQKEIYREYYGASRFRRLSFRYQALGRHGDLYAAMLWLFARLESLGVPELGIKPPGGFLWSGEAMPDLAAAKIANVDLLWAINRLAWMEAGRASERVDFRHLGAEEIGGIFESLLEIHPVLDVDANRFVLRSAKGNERKTTGSYYTPESLIQNLLDTVLEPVLDKAARAVDPAAALENLKICDPACGSGHFLAAAAHRLAKRLAQARTARKNASRPDLESEPDPDEVRSALRQVIGDCLYGVDSNEMAVELCKVSLWLEAQDPDIPLSFLDSHIRQGNSLFGATPELLAKGIPDKAYAPLGGDDKKACRVLKAENRNQGQGQGDLFSRLTIELKEFGQAFAGLTAIPDQSAAGIRERAARYHDITRREDYRKEELLARAWCAAFVWKKLSDASAPRCPTHATLGQISRDGEAGIAADQLAKINRLTRQYRFFAWHLAFSEVFFPADGGEGGFDCVLGNPPWKKVKLQEKKWFASRDSKIAAARNKEERRRLIDHIKIDSPELYAEFVEAGRQIKGESAFIHNSGRFPLCGRGDVNTYAVFAELMRGLARPGGRAGCIVPSGLATDDTTKLFFQDLMRSGSLDSFFDFENKREIFPVHRSFKFALLTIRRPATDEAKAGEGAEAVSDAAEFAFFLQGTDDLSDPERRFRLSCANIKLVNPNTLTSPICRSRKDAELTKYIYRRMPVLWREAAAGEPEANPWGVSFDCLFHMSNDSRLFHIRTELENKGWELRGNVFERENEKMLPLYEAKMAHQFDHRWANAKDRDEASGGRRNRDAGDETDADEGEDEKGATETGEDETGDFADDMKADPRVLPMPRYWVAEAEVEVKLRGKWNQGWLMGWRDITNATNERTLIASAMPRVAVGNSFPLLYTVKDASFALLACLNALCCDFFTRQKIGGTHLNYFIFRQIPIIPPDIFDQSSPLTDGQKISDWLRPRILELVYTAFDLAPFARRLGYNGQPFVWNRERRFKLRAELDALFFHLYLGGPREWRDTASPELKNYFPAPRQAVLHILDSFPILKRKDEAACNGQYRTRDAVLAEYDRLAEKPHFCEGEGV